MKDTPPTPPDADGIREIEIRDGADSAPVEETGIDLAPEPEPADPEADTAVPDDLLPENPSAEDAPEEAPEQAEPDPDGEPTPEPTREEMLEEMLSQMVPASVATALEERAHAAESRLQAFAAAFDKYKAEHEAIRGRLERDQETRVRTTLSRTFLEILGALDNLERSLDHAEETPYSEGLRLVHKQFLDILRAEGLEKLEVLGEVFDPERAEAVLATPVEDPEQENRVLEVFRPGYGLGGHVIRPAQVRVGKVV